jgi:MFS family permease
MALAIGYAAAGFLAAGFSEVLSPLFGLLMLIVWWRVRQPRYLAVFLGLVVGTLVVLLAPGNAVRAAALPPRMSIIVAFQQSVQAMTLFIVGTIIQQPLGLVLAFIIGWLSPVRKRVRRRLRWILIVVLVAIPAMAFTLFVPYYGASGLDARHFTFCTVIFIATIFTIGVLCAVPRSSVSP